MVGEFESMPKLSASFWTWCGVVKGFVKKLGCCHVLRDGDIKILGTFSTPFMLLTLIFVALVLCPIRKLLVNLKI